MERGVAEREHSAVGRDEPVATAARRTRHGDDRRLRLSGAGVRQRTAESGIAEGKDTNSTSVKEICTEQLFALKPDDSVEDAIRLMRERAIRRVPVLEDGNAVGIVSLGDLAVEQDERSVLGQVSAAPPNN